MAIDGRRSPGADGVVRVAEQRFAADIALVVKLLQSHLAANTNYRDADAGERRSAAIARPGPVRAVVLTLIDETRKVQVKIDELSKTLDESVNKFEKLRSNLADANDKAMRDSLTGLATGASSIRSSTSRWRTIRSSAC